MDKITIAMPVYNVGQKVRKAVESALNQTYPDIELLVIDDKGTDNSIDIVREVAAEHPRGNCVKIIDHVVNKGTGATKNTAMDNASGKYLYFMDSDDIIKKDCIEKLYSIAEQHNVEIVAASHAATTEALRIKKVISYPTVISTDRTLKDYTIHGNWPFLLYTWNKLYRLSFLRDNNIRCIPYHLCEDLYFSMQVRLKCKSFATISDVTYAYIDNPNSLMGRGYRDKLLLQMNEVMDAIVNYVAADTDLVTDELVIIDLINYAIACMFNIANSGLITEEQRKQFKGEICTSVNNLMSISKYRFQNELKVAMVDYCEKNNIKIIKEIYKNNNNSRQNIVPTWHIINNKIENLFYMIFGKVFTV